ncbi:MAG: TRAP transporter small permease [Candidatus Methylomirabilota bacterium]
MNSFLGVAQRAIDAAVRWLIIILMVVMTITVSLQILFRYIFNIPLGWSEEAARFAFVWVAFFGASALLRIRKHINVTVFTDRFPTRLRNPCVLAANLCGLVCVFFIFVGGIELTRNEWRQLAPALEVPMGWIYLAIPISATLMGLWGLIQTFDSLVVLVRGGRR